jgi:hypothetical protein
VDGLRDGDEWAGGLGLRLHRECGAAIKDGID